MEYYTFLYIRKSSEEDDRQSLSLDAQEQECRGFATRSGFEINEVIREAHTARKPGRPRFNRMLGQIEEYCLSGRTVQVLCHKPDRLLRNLADWAKVNDLMDLGVLFTFVTGSYSNNAQGRMAFGINVVFAKYYVDNLSEEVKKGHREKIRRGEWPGAAPLGYLNVAKKIEVDPIAGPIVREAFEAYHSGAVSLETLRERLTTKGLCGRRRARPISKSRLHAILGNPFYCGFFRHQGELVPAAHEPLVSVQMFEETQKILHRRTASRPHTRHFRYRGLLTCAQCGCAVVGDRKIKRRTYVYYRCTRKRGHCSERAVREELLDEMLMERISNELYLPEWAQELLRQAAEDLARAQDRGLQSRELLERRCDELRHRLSALLDLRLAGDVDQRDYATKKAELTLALARATEDRSALENRTFNPQKSIDWFIGACNSSRIVFQESNDDEIRRLLNLVGSNYILGDKMVDFQPVGPFAMVSQERNRSVWRQNLDEARTFSQLKQSPVYGQVITTARVREVSGEYDPSYGQGFTDEEWEAIAENLEAYARELWRMARKISS